LKIPDKTLLFIRSMVGFDLTSYNNPFPLKGYSHLVDNTFLVVNFHAASSPSFPYTQARLQS